MMISNEYKSLYNLIRKWRRQSEDHGPMAARAYLDAANQLEAEIKKLAQQARALDAALQSDAERALAKAVK